MAADPLDKLSTARGGPDVGAALRVIRKRKWMILAIAIAVPTAVAFAASRQTKIYRADASMIIDISLPQYLGAGFREVIEVEASWWTSHEYMETENRVLRSYTQAMAVARALCERKLADGKLAAHGLLPGANCSDPKHVEQVAKRIQETIQIEPVKDSRIVSVSATSTTPEFAALLANTHAQVFLERNLERRLSQSQTTANWLGNEYGDLAKQLHDAEQAMVEYKKKSNIVAVSLEDDQTGLAARRKIIAAHLSEVEVKLIVLRSQREMYGSIRSTDPVMDYNPALAESEIGRKLKELYLEQYSKMLEVRSKYLEKHPVIVAFESRLQAIKADLLREIEHARKNVDAQYQTLTKQSNDLKIALDATTKQALALESKASEFNHLKREVDRLRKLTEHVGGREQETTVATHLKANNVRILDAARAPVKPVSPDVPRATAMAAAVGILLALGLAILLESLDSTIKTQEDLEQHVGVSFLGLIPSIEVERPENLASNGNGHKDKIPDSKDTFVWRNPKSSIAECCRSIRTNLLFMSPDKPARTLLVTSANPQEGKTTVAVNLAITLAQSGMSVLLVDTDMRRPRLHTALGIPATGDGISKAVVGECEVASVVRNTEIPNLFVLPCGARPPNPAELLHSERFASIVRELSERYDRVIFDSPPLGPVTDPAILARLTDGTILVAKAGRTTREGLSRARQQVTGDGRVNILGCIINDLDVNRKGGYGYYYYYYYSRYGSYYGDDPAPAPGQTPSA